MKRFIALLAVTLSLAAAGSAGAAITITQAPAGPGYQNLNPFPDSAGLCGGHGGTYSASGNPIRLQFGWGAHTTAQMDGFFKNSHGSVSITGTDTFSDSWANSPSGSPFVSQQGIAWSALAPTTLQTPGNSPQTLSGYNSFYRGVLTIAPGTYTLTEAYVFDKPVQDGFGSYKGTLSSTCTFTVTA